MSIELKYPSIQRLTGGTEMNEMTLKPVDMFTETNLKRGMNRGKGETEILSQQSLGKAEHAFNPSTPAETGRSLWFQGQPGLCGEFQASLAYTVRYCLHSEVLSQNKL